MESSWSSCYYRLIYSSLNSEVYYRAVGDHEHDGPSPKEACRAEVRTIAAHNPLQHGINKYINKTDISSTLLVESPYACLRILTQNVEEILAKTLALFES